MQNNINKINKVKIVSENYAKCDVNTEEVIEYVRNIYKKGFVRGVEKMTKPNHAWIKHDVTYDALHGFRYLCTCGNCGYVSTIGESKFCPDCGVRMNLKFEDDAERKEYVRKFNQRFNITHE